jgi:multiple sugar transport system permease protein
MSDATLDTRPGAAPGLAPRPRFTSKRTAERRERSLALILIVLGSLTVFVPIAYLISDALSGKETLKVQPKPLLPSESYTVTIDGKPCYVYDIEIDGKIRPLAVVAKNGGVWTYADPADPTKTWDRDAEAVDKRTKTVTFHPENFGLALQKAPFGRYVANTLLIMLLVTIGTVASSVMVAFAFARYRLKGMPALFMVLLATLMLPSQVVLIPTFVVFKSIGWYNTFLPLIIPAFFANAWDVFLFRQFFMGIPRELDEAAKMDGCSPLRTLWSVILPQAAPVVLTVTLFTMIYVWNDFFNPLIYLQDPNLFTVAVGLQNFSALYFNNAHLQASGALMMMLPPVLIFFLAQRYFIQGTVVSGVKG